MRHVCALVLLAGLAGGAGAAPEAQQESIYHARDAVLPALVHIQPISEVYISGERKKESSVGSGVLFDEKGHVVTNYHVAGKAQKLICTLSNKERISAELVGGDPYTDIAVIRLKLEETKAKLSPAKLGDSDRLEVGQFVLAMGSPLALSRTVSCGVISCVDRYLDTSESLPSGERTGLYNTWIQTDAAINPGNSGGPLVNLAGEVVGINARAYMFADNLGFAIPINLVKRTTDEILRTGKVTRSWAGLNLQPLQELGAHFGVDERVGVLVSGVDPGSPAVDAGIETGDIMTEFDGMATTARFQEEVPAIAGRIADTSVGKEVSVKLLRGGKAKEVKLTTKPLGKAEGEEFAADAWGFAVKGISRQMMLDMMLPSQEGVLVTGVKTGREVKSSDLWAEDVVVEVNRQKVADLAGFKAVYKQLSDQREAKLVMKIARKNSTRLVPVTPNYAEAGKEKKEESKP